MPPADPRPGVDPRVLQQDRPDGPRLTERGLLALDGLADVLVHRMAKTPEGIARTFDEVMHAPLVDLREALACVDHHLQRRRHPA